MQPVPKLLQQRGRIGVRPPVRGAGRAFRQGHLPRPQGCACQYQVLLRAACRRQEGADVDERASSDLGCCSCWCHKRSCSMIILDLLLVFLFLLNHYPFWYPQKKKNNFVVTVSLARENPMRRCVVWCLNYCGRVLLERMV